MFSKGKNFKKIAVRVVLLLLVAFILTPQTAQAVMPGCEVPSLTDEYKPIKINFPLPNITEGPVSKTIGDRTVTEYYVKNLSCFVIGIYVYFASVVGILATVMIMYGGVKYLISMGSPQRMADAKDTIFSAVVGLVLVLGAYMLLNLINPNLVELKEINPKQILPIYDLRPCSEYADNVTPEITGNKLCGDFGIVIDSINFEETDEYSRCYYTDGCDAGTICLHGKETDPWADVYTCQEPKKACERIDDENAPTQSQTVCSPYSVDGLGACIWMDRAWYDFIDWDDECKWFPQVTCFNNTWDQVNCSQCANEYNGTDIMFQPGWFSGTYYYNVCVDTNAYENDPTNQPPGDVINRRGICCKKINNDNNSTEYSVGDVYYSQKYWNPVSNANK